MTCFCTPCHEKALKQVLCVLACDNDVGQTFQTEFEKDEPLVAYRDAVCLEVLLTASTGSDPSELSKNPLSTFVGQFGNINLPRRKRRIEFMFCRT